MTDLHGYKWKYEKVAEIAAEQKIDAVINGGDMFPTGENLLQQGDFISRFLDDYFSQFNSKKIHYLCCPGNDDLKIFDALLDETCDKYTFVKNLAQRKTEIQGYEFIGMNYVADYPFTLKDRCRMDTDTFVFPPQYGKGALSTAGGFEYLDDWFSYAQTLPTLEMELEKLVRPGNMRKCVYIIHMPPAGLGLDVCSDGREVGSKALYRFLEKNQPLLSLHGHIHESPIMSRKWYSPCGAWTLFARPGEFPAPKTSYHTLTNRYQSKTITTCIQPGQLDDLTYVLIDLASMTFQRYGTSFSSGTFSTTI